MKVLANRFEVISRLGKGGMGEVYHVSDQQTGKECAVKQLINSFGPSAPRPDLFKREFEILSKMDHPNIVKVYELIESPAELLYTMELLPGQELKDWLLAAGDKGQRGNEVEALEILLQIAKALHHVHEKGIIHHDVHPHNVKLIKNDTYREGLQVKLLDFGISLLKEEQSEKEITIGARDYKSPEHHRGDKLDYTADIYCFGAIAYEVLTGKQPFSLAERGLERSMMGFFVAMAMHSLREVPKIKGLNKRVAFEINRMVQICMEKEAEDRYQSMQDVADRLEVTISKIASNKTSAA